MILCWNNVPFSCPGRPQFAGIQFAVAENRIQGPSNMESKEATTKRIMDAALWAFAEKGVHQVTVRAIAERAGISTTRMYQFFPGKEELLIAVVADKLMEMTNGLREHLQAIVGTANKLRKCTWFILHFFGSCPEFASLMFVSNPLQIWGRPRRVGPIADQAQILTEIVHEGQLAGEFRSDIDIKQLRDLYFGGLQRMTYLWLVRGMPYKLTDVADGFTSLVFDGIKQPEVTLPKCPFLEELEAIKKRSAQPEGGGAEAR